MKEEDDLNKEYGDEEFAYFGIVPEDIENRQKEFRKNFCLKCDYLQIGGLIESGSCKLNKTDIIGDCWNYSTTTLNPDYESEKLENKIAILELMESGQKYPVYFKDFTIGYGHDNLIILKDSGIFFFPQYAHFYCKNSKKSRFYVEEIPDFLGIKINNIRKKKKNLLNGDVIELFGRRFKFIY